MIYESSYWKEDLLKQAKSLRGRQKQSRWPERSFARFEQTVMLGFYSIRKLTESSKLSNSLVEGPVALTLYPSFGKLVTRWNLVELDENYDFASPSEIEKDLGFLCNQIVHSYLFVPEFNDQNLLHGILFNSDRTRNTALFSISLEQIIALFERTGNDYPNASQMTFNEKRQDYDVVSFTSTDLERAT